MYGPVSPTGAPYTVQMDNGTAQYFNSNRSQYTPQMLLYQATNLGLGSHKVKMTVQSTAGSSQSLAIDYARVYTTFQSRYVLFSWHFFMNDANPSVYNSTSTTNSSGKVPSGAVSTGVVVGVAFAAFALGFLAFSVLGFILLRRREARAKELEEKVQPFDPPQPEVVSSGALGYSAPSGSDSNRNLSSRTRNDPFQVGNGMRKEQPFSRQPEFASTSSPVSYTRSVDIYPFDFCLSFNSRHPTLGLSLILIRELDRTSCQSSLMDITARSRILVVPSRDRRMLRRSRLMKGFFHLIMLRRRHI